MSVTASGGDYTGTDNLEVMAEAENYNRFLLSLVTRHLKPGMRVADFGAGTGTFALPLQRQGVDITAIEPDATLNARLRQAGIAAERDAASLPGASLDLIYTFNVLEHIADDGGAVRTLARKLRPGGRLLVYVPAFAVLFTQMDHKVGHLRRYRLGGLRALVSGAGLAVDDVRYVDSLGFFATLAYRVLASGGDGSIDRRALRLYDRLIFPPSRVLDRLLSPWLGKNLLLLATKPAASEAVA
ncbi:MAG TPA: class I SAM-dependent methyltransferase [Stellaceae bacterium]|nr:class I SAM-dependent methyltransferase [Stellaceae bacterium]